MSEKMRFGWIGVMILIFALLAVMVPSVLAEEGEDPCADGHHWKDWEVTVEPGCTEPGEQTRWCKYCDASETEPLEAKGHHYEEERFGATCTEDGYTVYTCKRCGDSYTEASEGALGHNYEAQVTDPTCTEDGYTTYTCSRCGDSYTEAGQGALGHNYETQVTDPTCDTDGTVTYVCKRCGDSYSEPGESMLGHSYEARVTDPTCDADGYTTYTCARCGDSYTEAGASALGHDWGEWAEQPGMRTRACKRCGATESEEVEQTEVEKTMAGPYTITWKVEGKEDATTYWEEGQTPAYSEPTSWEDANYYYSITGWAPEIAVATADATYTATVQTVAKITLTVNKNDGTAVTTIVGKAGATIEASQVPSTTREHYTFVNWTKQESGKTETKTVATFPETFPDASATFTANWKPNITAIPLEDVKLYIYKPALADAKALLPTTVPATLADGTTVQATLTWKDNTDYGDKAEDASGDGTYEFTAETVTAKDAAGNDYVLDAGVTVTCNLVIGPLTSGDFQYHLESMDPNSNAIVTNWTNVTDPATAEIPASFTDNDQTHTVVAIGPNAFKGKTNLATLTLPVGGTLKSIGLSAFEGCTKLTTLVVPAGAQSIGNRAFAGCTALTSLTLPDTLNTIGTDIIADDAARTHLVFAPSLGTTLTSTTTYTRYPVQGEPGYSEDPNVPMELMTITLPAVVTDLSVSSGEPSKFILACDFTVEPEHKIEVLAGAEMETGAVTVLNAGNINVQGKLRIVENATVSSTGTMDFGGTVSVHGLLSNTGTVNNTGTLDLHSTGTVITCGGTWTGNAASGSGTLINQHAMSPDSKFENEVCRYCSFTQAFNPKGLTVKYNGPTLYKVYDKTTNIKDDKGKWLLTDKEGNTHSLAAKDFTFETTQGYEKVTVTPSSITAFSAADAKSYKLTVTVKVAGDHAGYYLKEADRTIKIEIPAEITKRPVVVTPKAGLTKVYGTADPSSLGLNCTVPGLLALTSKEKAEGKSLFTGKMGRKEGENVGKYQYTLGTLDFGNDNYTVSIATETFEITQKDINSTNVGLVTIGNQKYTGKPITPEITLRYTTDITTKLNADTLKQGTDFTAAFSNNTEPGTAKVVLTGKGNYTGKRETSFNILKVTDDTSGGTEGSGGGGGGGGSYSHEGFDGEGDDYDDDDSPDSADTLVLDDVDYGTILFDAKEQPRPFESFPDIFIPEEGDDSEPYGILTIIPDPMVDEVTGQGVLLEDGRPRYDELHLRLNTTLVETLAEQGFTEIVYELEQATLHIPLTSLVSEIPATAADAADFDVQLPPVQEEGGDTLELEPTDEFTLEGDGIAETFPEESVAELAPEMIQVDSYDIYIEQADANGLTERETALLAENEVMVPAYRLRLKYIPVGAEQVPTGETDEEGNPITAPVPQSFPEGVYLEDLTLALHPSENLAIAPEGIQLVYASIIDAVEDADVSELIPVELPLPEEEAEEDEEMTEFEDPASTLVEDQLLEDMTEEEEQSDAVAFVDVDGVMEVQLPLTTNGMYAVIAPQDWDPTPYLATENPDATEAPGTEAPEGAQTEQDTEEFEEII